jgi:hypothetical protein
MSKADGILAERVTRWVGNGLAIQRLGGQRFSHQGTAGDSGSLLCVRTFSILALSHGMPLSSILLALVFVAS